MKPIAAFICLLAIAYCAANIEELDKRIVNGEVVNTSSYPYMASLQLCLDDETPVHYCGAVLVGPDKLLTAAHCVADVEASDLCAVLGVSNIHPANIHNGQIVRVKRFVLHPGYTEDSNNDIAIVYLQRSVRYNTKVQPAKLAAKGSTFVWSKCAVAGWGVTEINEYEEYTNELRHANVTKISNEFCKLFYPTITIRETKICLFQEDVTPGLRPDTCQGDSGGPVMCGDNLNLLTGITSYGIGCGDHHPGVYTRVSSYLDWIKRN